jgi:hypothetical protein
MGRIPTGPNSLPVLERYLAVLAAASLPPRVIAYASDMFSLFVGAFAFEESMPPPDVAALDAALQGLSPEEYPHLTRLSADLMAGDTDERFEWALELLVRGLEALRETGDEHRL